MLIYCLCGCKVTKKKIIQTNNSPKNDIFQTNNLLKNDFFQRNNSWKLTFSKQIICRKMTFSKEIIFFERGGNWDFLYLRSFRCFRTLRSWKRHKVCLNMNFAKFEEFASAYFFFIMFALNLYKLCKWEVWMCLFSKEQFAWALLSGRERKESNYTRVKLFKKWPTLLTWS